MDQRAGEIRITPVSQVSEAARLLAVTLAETPLSQRRLPDPARRLRILQGFLAAATRDAIRRGQALAAVDAGEGALLGVLLVMPPAGGRPPVTARIRVARAMLRAARLAPRAFAGYLRSVRAQREDLPPPGDWWYFHSLGVAPAARGRGIARQLLAYALRRVDAGGLPAYTHAANPTIATILHGLGFQAEQPIAEAFAAGAPYLPMHRPGRPAPAPTRAVQ